MEWVEISPEGGLARNHMMTLAQEAFEALFLEVDRKLFESLFSKSLNLCLSSAL